MSISYEVTSLIRAVLAEDRAQTVLDAQAACDADGHGEGFRKAMEALESAQRTVRRAERDMDNILDKKYARGESSR